MPMSDTMALEMIWLGLTSIVMALGVHSNRWELYGISALSFLFYALTSIPEMLGIVCLALAVANIGRMVWCWIATRPKTR